MNQDRRRPVVTALINLAASDDYQDRADAGRALANFTKETESRESLLRLVLDVGDTFVTLATAEALLRRQDTVGLTIVADALVSADFQHRTAIHDAVIRIARFCGESPWWGAGDRASTTSGDLSGVQRLKDLSRSRARVGIFPDQPCR